MAFVERCFGVAAPYDPWYQKVQLSLALELPRPTGSLPRAAT